MGKLRPCLQPQPCQRWFLPAGKGRAFLAKTWACHFVWELLWASQTLTEATVTHPSECLQPCNHCIAARPPPPRHSPCQHSWQAQHLSRTWGTNCWCISVTLNLRACVCVRCCCCFPFLCSSSCSFPPRLGAKPPPPARECSAELLPHPRWLALGRGGRRGACRQKPLLASKWRGGVGGLGGGSGWVQPGFGVSLRVVWLGLCRIIYCLRKTAGCQ